MKVPSHNVNIIGGPANYWCMVTSLYISENARGYRGSKSDFNLTKFVKEQRVYGS